MIGTVLELSDTDIEKFLFYSTCFSSAHEIASATRKVFWLALLVLMFLLPSFLFIENLERFSQTAK